MSKRILIDGTFPHQYRVALVNAQNRIEELEYETANLNQIKGNIYLAKIVRIEPGLQAAFIEYGGIKNGFLPFSEIHPDYYNIQVTDKKTHTDFANLHAITPPSLDDADIGDEPTIVSPQELEKDFDIAQIEKFIDEDKEPELSSDVSEIDIDKISDDKIEPLALYKQYKIQEVIKKGQVILVQAQKEERGNKGASFTSYLSLAGKYCVLMPNNPGHHGISRRISSSEERKRLRNIISKLVNEQNNKFASAIIRTAGIGRTAQDIKRDYEYLVNLWNHIREMTLKSKAPSFIHIEEGIIQKTIRDLYDSSVNQLIIDGEEAYENARKFMQHLLPTDVNKIKLHSNLVPIFSDFKVEDQVAGLYQQFVSLPSGGYIVINPTEALTSIDVNSGRSTSEKNIEETALKTNVEATKEIARQFKLRDISGLIVIDFIDMSESRNRKIVERSLKEYVSRDKAKIQIGHISTFGLLELSRQRLRPSFLESHTKMCTHCNGKGIIRDEEANATVIFRTLENEIHALDADIANIFANSNIVLYLLNYKRLEIALIEEKYGIKLNFLVDHAATSDSFSIEKISLPVSEISYGNENYEAPQTRNDQIYKNNPQENENNKNTQHKNGNKRRKWKDGGQQGQEPQPQASKEQVEPIEKAFSEPVEGNIEHSTENEEVKKDKPRRRKQRRSPRPKVQTPEDNENSDG